MNRCPNDPRSSFLRPLALSFLLALTAVPALAQNQARPEQNEAAAGGRNFPVGTLRGKMTVLNAHQVKMDSNVERLMPGTRIRNAQNMQMMSGALAGQAFVVNYTRDAAGALREIWILSEREADTERTAAEKPLLNFWPFN